MCIDMVPRTIPRILSSVGGEKGGGRGEEGGGKGRRACAVLTTYAQHLLNHPSVSQRVCMKRSLSESC